MLSKWDRIRRGNETNRIWNTTIYSTISSQKEYSQFNEFNYTLHVSCTWILLEKIKGKKGKSMHGTYIFHYIVITKKIIIKKEKKKVKRKIEDYKNILWNE